MYVFNFGASGYNAEGSVMHSLKSLDGCIACCDYAGAAYSKTGSIIALYVIRSIAAMVLFTSCISTLYVAAFLEKVHLFIFHNICCIQIHVIIPKIDPHFEFFLVFVQF